MFDVVRITSSLAGIIWPHAEHAPELPKSLQMKKIDEFQLKNVFFKVKKFSYELQEELYRERSKALLSEWFVEFVKQ